MPDKPVNVDLQQQKLADLWESQMSTNNALQSVTFHFSKFHYYYLYFTIFTITI